MQTHIGEELALMDKVLKQHVRYFQGKLIVWQANTSMTRMAFSALFYTESEHS